VVSSSPARAEDATPKSMIAARAIVVLVTMSVSCDFVLAH
jgi:hypothetical protein